MVRNPFPDTIHLFGAHDDTTCLRLCNTPEGGICHQCKVPLRLDHAESIADLEEDPRMEDKINSGETKLMWAAPVFHTTNNSRHSESANIISTVSRYINRIPPSTNPTI